MNVRSYSKQFINEFIDLYASLQGLWKVKKEDYNYTDRIKSTMIEKLRDVNTHLFTTNQIKFQTVLKFYRKFGAWKS